MTYSDLNNIQLVTLAIANLGGFKTHVDKEDIALLVDKWVSGRFSWKKYPDRIDLEVVSNALRDARKTRYGALIDGSNANGWILTSAGVEWISSLDRDKINAESSISEESFRRGSIQKSQEIERNRLRETKAFKLYKSKKIDNINEQLFYEFARINEYFTTQARQKRYVLIENAVATDDDLKTLWGFLLKTFDGDNYEQ